MSRKIKFRVWDDTHNRMVYLGLAGVNCSSEGEAKLVFGDDFHDDFHEYQMDVNKIMQYTGIKDSDDADIYDGDIIKVAGMYGEIQYAKVIWGPVSNMYTWMNGETWLLHFDSGAEGPLYPYCRPHHGYKVLVAGNIYEHPELLKEGKNE